MKTSNVGTISIPLAHKGRIITAATPQATPNLEAIQHVAHFYGAPRATLEDLRSQFSFAVSHCALEAQNQLHNDTFSVAYDLLTGFSLNLTEHVSFAIQLGLHAQEELPQLQKATNTLLDNLSQRSDFQLHVITGEQPSNSYMIVSMPLVQKQELSPFVLSLLEAAQDFHDETAALAETPIGINR